jgi:hypothetical protein
MRPAAGSGEAAETLPKPRGGRQVRSEEEPEGRWKPAAWQRALKEDRG